MFTKTKTALAATLVLGSTSLALAQGYDPNLANRYPHLANPQTYGYVAGANTPARMEQAPNAGLQSAPVRLRQRHDSAGARNQAPNATFRSAPVQLRTGRDVGPINGRGNYSGQESEFDVDRSDRASSPYAGGGF
jgi:hypothetical protein